MGDRKCSECKHYVVKDEKINYEQNGCGTYTQKIYGCELWDCEFQPKEENYMKSDKPDPFDPEDLTHMFDGVTEIPKDAFKDWTTEELLEQTRGRKKNEEDI